MYNNGTVSNETAVNYTYGDANWGDLLTGYDGEGISYDAIGNPLSYYNGKRYTFSWLYGRRLASSVVDGKTTTYTYNTEGLRLTKTASGVVHTYYWDGSTLLMEKWGNSYLRFLYDESGAPLRVEYYNGSTTTVYYYVLNLQGDVLEIRDTANNVVCRYSYDAWGKLLSVKDGSGNSIASATHIGILNPLRYRGYYYDTETGLYYLQSRYYDPQVGRFISADGMIQTPTGNILSTNMFAYCENNPVSFCDSSGYCKEMWDQGIAGPCPGPGRCPDYSSRDVTEEIDNALSKAVKRARKARWRQIWLPGVGIAIKYVEFYNLVNHGAPWDIKELDSWKETIGTDFPGKDIYVQYHGNYMTPEHLGNYTYGYLGAAYGIDLDILLAGSYYAAGFPISGDALKNEVGSDWFFVTYGYYQYRFN